MRKGHVYAYYGEGRGKTTLAIGQGVRTVGEEHSVIMIQFLDYNNTKEFIVLQKLEPDFKVFRFEKQRPYIDESDDDLRKEIQNEINNAFNFSKKILETGECDLLILDGVIDAVIKGYVDETSLCEILEKRNSYMDVILTGSSLCNRIAEHSDFVYNISTKKQTEKEN